MTKMKMIVASIAIAVCVSTAASAHMPDREEAMDLVKKTAKECVTCCTGWELQHRGKELDFTAEQCRIMCTIAAIEGYRLLVSADAANELYDDVISWLEKLTN